MSFQSPAQKFREAEAKERAQKLEDPMADIQRNIESALIWRPPAIPDTFEERVATAMISATVAQAQATALLVKELWALRDDLARRAD